MKWPLCFLALLSALPAFSWNATGHRICAAITYDHLTPPARARVDEILRHHPDYFILFTRDAPQDPAARARAAFLAAAVWPDSIRNDPRFYDESKADAQPTPLLPGFPDMQRHTNWHYINLPYSPEGLPAKVEPPPTALSELERILNDFRHHLNENDWAYDLPWLLHLEEDVHEPLHDINRYLKSQPKGDEGGNLVYVHVEKVQANGRIYRTLHSVWDQAGGTDTSDANVNRAAAELAAEFPPDSSPKDPKKWVDEGFKLAKSAAYTFGPVTGTQELPLKLPENYESEARRLVRKQIAEAGFRMAAVLNKIFIN